MTDRQDSSQRPTLPAFAWIARNRWQILALFWVVGTIWAITSDGWSTGKIFYIAMSILFTALGAAELRGRRQHAQQRGVDAPPDTDRPA